MSVATQPVSRREPLERAAAEATDLEAFRIGAGTHFLSGLFSRFPRFWRRMATLETRVLQDQLAAIELTNPVYVSGLARAGTTLLLEILASHPDAATHQYRDFPGIMIPYWWSRSQSPTATADERAVERAHGDRMQVTSQSPEAMEEMLWMACFDQLHDPKQNQVMDRTTEHPDFVRLYRDHLRKLLLVRGQSRYVAKGNYNLTRLGFLHQLFPAARFVIAIRNPQSHLASLIKQHRLFCRAEKAFPRALAHMQRVGHFEFGLDVRLINTGSRETIDSIEALWASGQSVRGWARYWAMVYRWLDETLDRDEELAAATQVVRYEELCDDPRKTLGQLLPFVQLESEDLVERWSDRISAPSYYQSGFSDQDLGIIAEETGDVAARFGYSSG